MSQRWSTASSSSCNRPVHLTGLRQSIPAFLPDCITTILLRHPGRICNCLLTAICHISTKCARKRIFAGVTGHTWTLQRRQHATTLRFENSGCKKMEREACGTEERTRCALLESSCNRKGRSFLQGSLPCNICKRNDFKLRLSPYPNVWNSFGCQTFCASHVELEGPK